MKSKIYEHLIESNYCDCGFETLFGTATVNEHLGNSRSRITAFGAEVNASITQVEV